MVDTTNQITLVSQITKIIGKANGNGNFLEGETMTKFEVGHQMVAAVMFMRSWRAIA